MAYKCYAQISHIEFQKELKAAYRKNFIHDLMKVVLVIDQWD
jgi:hypothetical protein